MIPVTSTNPQEPNILDEPLLHTCRRVSPMDFTGNCRFPLAGKGKNNLGRHSTITSRRKFMVHWKNTRTSVVTTVFGAFFHAK